MMGVVPAPGLAVHTHVMVVVLEVVVVVVVVVVVCVCLCVCVYVPWTTEHRSAMARPDKYASGLALNCACGQQLGASHGSNLVCCETHPPTASAPLPVVKPVGVQNMSPLSPQSSLRTPLSLIPADLGPGSWRPEDCIRARSHHTSGSAPSLAHKSHPVRHALSCRLWLEAACV